MNQQVQPGHSIMTRRDGLRVILGTSAMALAMPARLTFAAPLQAKDNSQKRLVVVMLRGALDGLAAIPAPGDPAWADLRGHAEAILRSDALAAASAAGISAGLPAAQTAALPLDGIFTMHPALVNLHKWYSQKELIVAHAVASPYRERSHFDAQQLLESGGDRPFVQSTGWLGRALQSSGQTAMALTASMPFALRGSDGASTWTPAGRASNHQDLVMRVAQMYGNDAPLSNALYKAIDQQDMSMGVKDGVGLAALARQAGKFLADSKGPKVAWLEAGGWDTHTQQFGRLSRLLLNLDEALAALRSELGSQWGTTTVLVITEFGRSATLNGTGGTDHGSAGVAFLAGGEVAGGRVVSDWPGVARAQLLDGRDLRPTLDIRRLISAVVQHQFGLSKSGIENTFPGAPSGLTDLYRV